MEESFINTDEGSYNIYNDIKSRTNGELYLGAVGPVRTGKSTFIKRFMDLLVLPNIKNEHIRQRTNDELPLSAAGNTITTTEPKFIPSDAAVNLEIEGINAKVRLIDCVGFMVDGALGLYENDKERMVKTPWSNTEIPFTKAAEIGTQKVIKDHATIGIVITCDGSFTDIDRASYVEPERRTINELKAIGKPFTVILNSARPYSKETVELAKQMENDYGVSVTSMNCDQLKISDIKNVFMNILREFPIKEIIYKVPQWIDMLSYDHWLKKEIIDTAGEILGNYTYMKDVGNSYKATSAGSIENINISGIDLSNGTVNIEFTINNNIYYEIISELSGTKIENEYELIRTIRELSSKKDEFDKVKNALSDVELNGFGVVTPVKENIILEEPAVIKNGNKYGVRIKASVPSINMLKTNINVEIAPIVGTKNQAEDLIEYINSNKDSTGIWDTNIFGKTVEQIISDGIYEKTHNITSDNMDKISTTIEKVMNENTGLVCLIV